VVGVRLVVDADGDELFAGDLFWEMMRRQARLSADSSPDGQDTSVRTKNHSTAYISCTATASARNTSTSTARHNERGQE
jgi:hypothetical protein